jgi:hypothetical protein
VLFKMFEDNRDKVNPVWYISGYTKVRGSPYTCCSRHLHAATNHDAAAIRACMRCAALRRQLHPH